MSVPHPSGVDELRHAPTNSLSAVLRIPDFRRLWIGLGLSSLGDWMGLLALTAIANASADSYAARNYAIAGVLFLRVLPALIMGPIAGYVADRLDRRHVLIWGDYIRGALFITIPIVDRLWWIFVVTVLVESVSLVWGPAKDATVPNLVPRHRLEAANQISLATTYGSALPAALVFSGLTLVDKLYSNLFSFFDKGPIDLALFFNAGTFIISGLVIATLKHIPRGPADTDGDGSVWSVVVEGWKYVSTTRVVRGLVIGIIGAFAAGGVVIGLARTFVADLGGGDPGYGILFGAVFLGLGVGMWRGPRLLHGLSRRRLFGISLTTTGLLLFPLALTQQLEIVTALTLLLGFSAGVAWIVGNTMLGLEVPDEVRGRTFAFVGSMIRLSLALVLAVAPLVAGVIGTHDFGPVDEFGRPFLVYNGAAFTFLIAAVLMTAVGVTSYRQMDDRKGISLLSDLRHAFSGTTGIYAATGCFVALEGGEGAGKSTQARRLQAWLRQEGYDVLLTHEPGATDVGSRLRKIVLDPATGAISDRTETLLYAADKAEHVEAVIAPALARGAVVVTDRYVDSTLAYQGAGRALVDREVERIARWATEDLRPHLTVVLDLPPQHGLTRFEERDRIESESLAFHERVREMFLQLASAQPERYLVVDARRPVEEVEAEIRQRLEPLLEGATRLTTEDLRATEAGAHGLAEPESPEPQLEPEPHEAPGPRESTAAEPGEGGR
ncbi:dTMP kinase [Nocardioides mesophilus]|uniref:Thymidylate kinase n=1 Tax=Nocardioides mesophilus TaxID=433659 RepID=A0A7G9RGF2_9ACTN|nr:dTMP kinase [Nocardioides mesophilus]QNN54677.1 dTMP kinase [Nocardioides mesophilus]